MPAPASSSSRSPGSGCASVNPSFSSADQNASLALPAVVIIRVPGLSTPYRRTETSPGLRRRARSSMLSSSKPATRIAQSHQNLALFADGALHLGVGDVLAEQHLVVRLARRDHREAIGERGDAAVEDHRALGVDHLADGVVEVGGMLATHAGPAV